MRLRPEEAAKPLVADLATSTRETPQTTADDDVIDDRPEAGAGPGLANASCIPRPPSSEYHHPQATAVVCPDEHPPMRALHRGRLRMMMNRKDKRVRASAIMAGRRLHVPYSLNTSRRWRPVQGKCTNPCKKPISAPALLLLVLPQTFESHSDVFVPNRCVLGARVAVLMLSQRG